MKKILIVEDDRRLNDGIRLALRNEFSCSQAFSLEEAGKMLGNGSFDLILLDVNLPDGSGLDLLAELRRTEETPVILLTANRMEMDIVSGLELGADDYITKPFSLMVLRARVGVQLRKKRREEGLSGEQQTELERKLIRAGSRSENVSTRSLIREIRQNEMLYFKQMVYIVGIAVTAFVLVLVNMINNLRYRMQSRTREICMLRAVGLSIPMVKRMLLFENLILGAVGILSGFLVLWPVLRYVYFSSEMNSFGHGFAFDWNSFGMVSAGTLLVCAGLSVRILKSWKSRSIMDGIGRFE